jgi:hypothetical protein
LLNSDEERWALAYFASTLSYSDADRQAGAKLWTSQPALHAAVPTLALLSQTSEAALAKTVGADAARQLTAYLRSTPGSVTASSTDSLMIARDKLKESLPPWTRATGSWLRGWRCLPISTASSPSSRRWLPRTRRCSRISRRRWGSIAML